MEILWKYAAPFIFGGFLCVIAQIFIDKTRLTPARILVSYVVMGVFLSAIGVFEPLIDIFGFGAKTPLLGFGYILAKGTREAIDNYGAMGIVTGGIGGAAFGIGAAIIFGYVFALLFKGKSK